MSPWTFSFRCRPFLKKLIASSISASLLWSFSSGATIASAMPVVLAPVSSLPQFQLTPPGRLGRMSDYFNAPQSSARTPLVVLIQDLHAHYGAQKNIAGLLEFLCSRLQTVGSKNPGTSRQGLGAPLPFALAVEGTTGVVDSSVMALFPDAAVKEEATQFLMRAGELNGTEYFAVRHGLPNALVGVEDSQLYETHRNLFRQTLAEREPLVKMLTSVQHDINDLPRRVYHGTLLALDHDQRAYDRGELSTVQFLSLVLGMASAAHLDWSASYPALASFGKNGRWDDETSAPVDLRGEIAEFLTSAQTILSSEEKKNLEVLGHQGESESYFLYLRDLVYQHQLFLGVPARLAQYMEYVHVSRTSGMDTVLHEATELFFELEKRAAQTSVERDVVQVRHDLNLLLRLADLQATEAEVRDFAPRLPAFISLTQTLVAGADHPNLYRADTLRRLISSSLDYYALAMMRNRPMLDNTLRLIAEPNALGGTNTVVLVAGGFHTAPLTQLLRAQNISYVVLTPAIDHVTEADRELYLKRLNGETLTDREVIDDEAPSRVSALLHPFAGWHHAPMPSTLAYMIDRSTLINHFVLRVSSRWPGRFSSWFARLHEPTTDQTDQDFLILAKGDDGFKTRAEHDAFNAKLRARLDLIVQQLHLRGIEVRPVPQQDQDGDHYDFRSMLNRESPQTHSLLVAGVAEIYLTPDGVLVIKSEYLKNVEHAGRDEFTAYASSLKTVNHEVAELREFAIYALQEGIATAADIFQGLLGTRYREWLNKPTVGFRHEMMLKPKLVKFHDMAVRAEENPSEPIVALVKAWRPLSFLPQGSSKGRSSARTKDTDFIIRADGNKNTSDLFMESVHVPLPDNGTSEERFVSGMLNDSLSTSGHYLLALYDFQRRISAARALVANIKQPRTFAEIYDYMIMRNPEYNLDATYFENFFNAMKNQEPKNLLGVTWPQIEPVLKRLAEENHVEWRSSRINDADGHTNHSTMFDQLSKKMSRFSEGFDRLSGMANQLSDRAFENHIAALWSDPAGMTELLSWDPRVVEGKETVTQAAERYLNTVKATLPRMIEAQQKPAPVIKKASHPISAYLAYPSEDKWITSADLLGRIDEFVYLFWGLKKERVDGESLEFRARYLVPFAIATLADQESRESWTRLFLKELKKHESAAQRTPSAQYKAKTSLDLPDYLETIIRNWLSFLKIPDTNFGPTVNQFGDATLEWRSKLKDVCGDLGCPATNEEWLAILRLALKKRESDQDDTAQILKAAAGDVAEEYHRKIERKFIDAAGEGASFTPVEAEAIRYLMGSDSSVETALSLAEQVGMTYKVRVELNGSVPTATEWKKSIDAYRNAIGVGDLSSWTRAAFGKHATPERFIPGAKPAPRVEARVLPKAPRDIFIRFLFSKPRSAYLLDTVVVDELLRRYTEFYFDPEASNPIRQRDAEDVDDQVLAEDYVNAAQEIYDALKESPSQAVAQWYSLIPKALAKGRIDSATITRETQMLIAQSPVLHSEPRTFRSAMLRALPELTVNHPTADEMILFYDSLKSFQEQESLELFRSHFSELLKEKKKLEIFAAKESTAIRPKPPAAVALADKLSKPGQSRAEYLKLLSKAVEANPDAVAFRRGEKELTQLLLDYLVPLLREDPSAIGISGNERLERVFSNFVAYRFSNQMFTSTAKASDSASTVSPLIVPVASPAEPAVSPVASAPSVEGSEEEEDVLNEKHPLVLTIQGDLDDAQKYAKIERYLPAIFKKYQQFAGVMTDPTHLEKLNAAELAWRDFTGYQSRVMAKRDSLDKTLVAIGKDYDDRGRLVQKFVSDALDAYPVPSLDKFYNRWVLSNSNGGTWVRAAWYSLGLAGFVETALLIGGPLMAQHAYAWSPVAGSLVMASAAALFWLGHLAQLLRPDAWGERSTNAFSVPVLSWTAVTAFAVVLPHTDTTVQLFSVLGLTVAHYATNLLAYFTRHRKALALTQKAADAIAHSTEHYDPGALERAANQNPKIIGQARVTLTDLQRAINSQA